MNNVFKTVTAIVAGVVVLIMILSIGTLVENVPADEFVVIQSPVSGNLKWYFEPGIKWQGWGKVTNYKRSAQYWFSNKKDQGAEADQSIKVRFNDGGHANLSGSVRIDLPMEEAKMTMLHKTFGSQIAIEQQLVRTVFEKSVYMTGPLMSSKESYAEKRSSLISNIEDQALSGIYKTISKEVKGKDPMTGNEKTVTTVELVSSPTAPNGIARQEDSPLHTFGIRAYNLSINSIDYDKDVEAQISTQQRAIMEVQTAMAEAKKAEQAAITAAKNGEANAAKAKWEQETIKAKEVTLAEQQRDVAKLQKDAAEYNKQKLILEGQGEAEKRRLAMAADGALSQKLNAWIEVNKVYANAIAVHPGPWVPSIIMGNSGGSKNAATDLMELLTVKTAKDLSLNMNMDKK